MPQPRRMPSYLATARTSPQLNSVCHLQNCLIDNPLTLCHGIVRKVLAQSKPAKQIRLEQRKRHERDDAAYARLVNARTAELLRLIEKLPAGELDGIHRDMLPNVTDAAELFSELIEGLVDDSDPITSVDDIGGDTAELWEVLDTYKSEVIDALAQSIPGAHNDIYGADTRKVLARASALFVCKECSSVKPKVAGGPVMAEAWPKINAHWRTCHPNESFYEAGQGIDDPRVRAKWWWEGHNTVKAILDAAGLSQARTAKIVGLEQLVREGRLFCGCGDPSLEQPAELTWGKLVRT